MNDSDPFGSGSKLQSVIENTKNKGRSVSRILSINPE